MTHSIIFRYYILSGICLILMLHASTYAAESLPIADAHVHYSHDSVELTPPSRVIELMKEGNLKFALVSSSDDNGTQLLSELAPDIIVPGLRPYRKRGELQTWFTDPDAMEYVEELLTKNRYAAIGEFHLYGADADLPYPRRIVELADTHNLILHAHSDADAVERLLRQSDTVKVLWAHSGFDSPHEIMAMLEKHDRLWADLAFRSEVGSGGSLSEDWVKLFTTYPDRMMLGTDTYTPERIYFLPEHANSARQWLATLPADLAEKIAWRNAYNLIMPVWTTNRSSVLTSRLKNCDSADNAQQSLLDGTDFDLLMTLPDDIQVSKPFSATLTLCGVESESAKISVDALMPAHGHGMNYTPVVKYEGPDDSGSLYKIDGLVMHMPGQWEFVVNVIVDGKREDFRQEFLLK